MEERFKAVPVTNNGSWAVFDTLRQCRVLQSVSPNASYNKEYAQKVAYLMNVVGGNLNFSEK